MNRRLLTQVVLPLVVAMVLTLLIHLRWPADGFFLNVAAGFVGSLVTVGYIDWILRRHERERWSEADCRVGARISKVAAATITGIRISLGYGTEIFDRFTMMGGDSEHMQREVLRVATHVLSPTADTRIKALNQEQWVPFVAHLQRSSAECGLILDRFGHRLEPETIASLLDLQEHLESAQNFWRVFPDIAGLPATQLPKTNTQPEELQAAWCELTAKDIRKILELSVKLSIKVNDL